MEDFTEEQAACLLRLSDTNFKMKEKIKEFNVFEYGGRIFKCSYDEAIQLFCKNNHNGDFLVWCQQNLKEI